MQPGIEKYIVYVWLLYQLDQFSWIHLNTFLLQPWYFMKQLLLQYILYSLHLLHLKNFPDFIFLLHPEQMLYCINSSMQSWQQNLLIISPYALSMILSVKYFGWSGTLHLEHIYFDSYFSAQSQEQKFRSSPLISLIVWLLNAEYIVNLLQFTQVLLAL